jgi:hypothetical protein
MSPAPQQRIERNRAYLSYFLQHTYITYIIIYIEYKDPHKVYLRDMVESVQKFRTYFRERKVVNTKNSYAVKRDGSADI